MLAGQEALGESGRRWLYRSRPGASLRAVRFTQQQVEEADRPGYWHQENDVRPEQTNLNSVQDVYLVVCKEDGLCRLPAVCSPRSRF